MTTHPHTEKSSAFPLSPLHANVCFPGVPRLPLTGVLLVKASQTSQQCHIHPSWLFPLSGVGEGQANFGVGGSGNLYQILQFCKPLVTPETSAMNNCREQYM